MSIEQERDQWLLDHDRSRVTHSINGGRHHVTVSCQEYDDAPQKDSQGVGKDYLEALLVALRNWESEWSYMESR